MVVPNKCFFCQYAYDKEQRRHTELPLHWLKINRHLHGPEGFNSAAGFVNRFDKNIVIAFEYYYFQPPLIFDGIDLSCFSLLPSNFLRSTLNLTLESICSLLTIFIYGYLSIVQKKLSLWLEQRSDLEHNVNKLVESNSGLSLIAYSCRDLTVVEDNPSS